MDVLFWSIVGFMVLYLGIGIAGLFVGILCHNQNSPVATIPVYRGKDGRLYVRRSLIESIR